MTSPIQADICSIADKFHNFLVDLYQVEHIKIEASVPVLYVCV